MLLPNVPAKADAQITEADMLQQLEIGKDLDHERPIPRPGIDTIQSCQQQLEAMQ